MSSLKVNSQEKEISTSEIFELKNSNVIFSDKLLIVKNEKTGKQFTISEEGFAILKANKSNQLTILNRNHA